MQEYKGISKLRQFYITRSLPNPSQFTVLVRGIPKSTEEPLTDTVKSFFTRYHGPSYLSHQMIYRVGKVQKIMVYNLVFDLLKGLDVFFSPLVICISQTEY